MFATTVNAYLCGQVRPQHGSQQTTRPVGLGNLWPMSDFSHQTLGGPGSHHWPQFPQTAHYLTTYTPDLQLHPGGQRLREARPSWGCSPKSEPEMLRSQDPRILGSQTLGFLKAKTPQSRISCVCICLQPQGDVPPGPGGWGRGGGASKPHQDSVSPSESENNTHRGQSEDDRRLAVEPAGRRNPQAWPQSPPYPPASRSPHTPTCHIGQPIDSSGLLLPATRRNPRWEGTRPG